MNPVLFFWADQAVFGNTETAVQKLKYATFEGGFFNFSWAKNLLTLEITIFGLNMMV